MTSGQATMEANVSMEAPVTLKAYFMCAFAAFGGIFFGFDSGHINGVMSMKYFIHIFTGLPYPGPGASADELNGFVIPPRHQSLIVSILSAGTFLGSIVAGDLSERIGRRATVIAGCVIFSLGVVLQTASVSLALLVAGRLIAGFGVGFVSAIIIVYMSEIAPKKVRGATLSSYQFCITVGLLLASCVDYATKDRLDSSSYRIPIAMQLLWSLILGIGLFLLPESPRYLVKKGRLQEAGRVLSQLREQSENSEYVRYELSEIVANYEYEIQLTPQGSYISSWTNCFSGSLWDTQSNLRRTLLGTSLQMMSQWTGVNFVFYYGTVFFAELGTIHDPFMITLITALVNVLSTPLSFWTIERFGRRFLILYGAFGMVFCQLIIAIVGTLRPKDESAMKAVISFICIYIFFFATTWGPACWTLVGEIFLIPIRARGIGLSTASNWMWNCIIASVTPYMVGSQYGNLGAKIFFIWGSLCTCAWVWGFFLVPETKGLSLEQIDIMMEESTPRKSASWVPHPVIGAEANVLNTAKGCAVAEIEAV